MIRDIIIILIGLAISLIITYILIIRKFYNFINNEIQENSAYRLNAEHDYLNSIPNKGVEFDEQDITE